MTPKQLRNAIGYGLLTWALIGAAVTAFVLVLGS